jgi:DNA-binding GntR family transcriptional regulator
MGKPSRIERIYSDLKEVLFSGPVRPSQRIDVDALAEHYHVSTMPIRLLLNRMVGAGVLEVVPHEGYVIPGATERRIRDVHRWNQKILMLALETAMDDDVPAEFPELSLDAEDVVAETEALFLAIADFSDTGETRRAISNVNDRLRPIRRLDTGDLIDVASEIKAFREAWQSRDLHTLHRLVWQYHDRRLALVPHFVALAYSQ